MVLVQEGLEPEQDPGPVYGRGGPPGRKDPNRSCHRSVHFRGGRERSPSKAFTRGRVYHWEMFTGF
jgi:hypothetical protein